MEKSQETSDDMHKLLHKKNKNANIIVENGNSICSIARQFTINNAWEFSLSRTNKAIVHIILFITYVLYLLAIVFSLVYINRSFLTVLFWMKTKICIPILFDIRVCKVYQYKIIQSLQRHWGEHVSLCFFFAFDTHLSVFTGGVTLFQINNRPNHVCSANHTPLIWKYI